MQTKESRYSFYTFIVVCIGYFLLMLSHISIAYLDFGDGNYLYIARRMLQGVMIYKDILSPQPPMHLLTGTLLLKIGDIVGNPLFIVRLFTILLRIVHAGLIFYLARQLFKKEASPWLPSMAGIMYLFLPIGFWWSRGYQSEPLEIFFILVSLIGFIRWTTKGMLVSGLFAGFAVLTNMTAAPYLVLTLAFLLIFEKKHLRYYGIASLGLIAVVTLFLQYYTGGMFIQNAILDQVGTYPKENTLGYMVGKMRWIGMVILQLEGFPILACLAGLGFYYKNQLHHRIKENPVQLYLLIYSLALLGSFVYATKGGTVDYIFTIGEPAVALFSIYGLSELSRKYTFPPISSSIVLGFLTVLFMLPGIPQNQKTLKGINFEIGADTTAKIVATIQSYAKPGELIFAPPYLAFLADRPIAGEFSEQYVWFLKYVNWLRVPGRESQHAAENRSDWQVNGRPQS